MVQRADKLLRIRIACLLAMLFVALSVSFLPLRALAVEEGDGITSEGVDTHEYALGIDWLDGEGDNLDVGGAEGAEGEGSEDELESVSTEPGDEESEGVDNADAADDADAEAGEDVRNSDSGEPGSDNPEAEEPNPDSDNSGSEEPKAGESEVDSSGHEGSDSVESGFEEPDAGESEGIYAGSDAKGPSAEVFDAEEPSAEKPGDGELGVADEGGEDGEDALISTKADGVDFDAEEPSAEKPGDGDADEGGEDGEDALISTKADGVDDAEAENGDAFDSDYCDAFIQPSDNSLSVGDGAVDEDGWNCSDAASARDTDLMRDGWIERVSSSSEVLVTAKVEVTYTDEKRGGAIARSAANEMRHAADAVELARVLGSACECIDVAGSQALRNAHWQVEQKDGDACPVEQMGAPSSCSEPDSSDADMGAPVSAPIRRQNHAGAAASGEMPLTLPESEISTRDSGGFSTIDPQACVVGCMPVALRRVSTWIRHGDAERGTSRGSGAKRCRSPSRG